MTTAEIRALIAGGDVSPFYNDRQWRRLSHDVRQEQHNECQYCKARGIYTPARHVHHVRHLRDAPELAYSRFFVDEAGRTQRQLVACCWECHEAQHPERFRRREGRQLNEERW
jgi:5-methylcytosine-specific restriction endonuclease McrA